MGYLEERLSEIDGRLLALLGLKRIGTADQHSSISSISSFSQMSKSRISKGLVKSANNTVKHRKNTPVDRAEKHEDSSSVETNVELSVDQHSSNSSFVHMSKSHTSQGQFKSTNTTVEYVKNSTVRVEMPKNSSSMGILVEVNVIS